MKWQEDLKKTNEEKGDKFQESVLIFQTWLSLDELAESIRLRRWWKTNCLVLAHFLKDVQTFYTFLICFNSVCILLFFFPFFFVLRMLTLTLSEQFLYSLYVSKVFFL